MITPETLAVLRCPIDPKREAKIVMEDDVRLYCEKCRVQFKIREGLPSLIPEEATLPPGYESWKAMPCRIWESKKNKEATSGDAEVS